jgi:hypothetical protein
VLISHTHRFIFIHVYKTGGQSVRVALEPFADLSHWPWRQRVRLWLGKSVVRQPPPLGWHAQARDIRAAHPASIFECYLKFAFVRNPWDWQVSLYHYILDHPGHDLHPAAAASGGFESFLLWRAEHDRQLQKTPLTGDDGRLLVDFVGRFETLEEDFATLCTALGLRARLPHVNRSRHGDYRTYYTPRTVHLVEEYWAEDIEMFGYTFEEPEPTAAPRVLPVVARQAESQPHAAGPRREEW